MQQHGIQIQTSTMLSPTSQSAAALQQTTPPIQQTTPPVQQTTPPLQQLVVDQTRLVSPLDLDSQATPSPAQQSTPLISTPTTSSPFSTSLVPMPTAIANKLKKGQPLTFDEQASLQKLKGGLPFNAAQHTSR